MSKKPNKERELSQNEAPPKTKNKDLLDPRQAEFLNNYLDPSSKTYGNALQSALKAGYSQEYAESITAKAPQWLSENVGEYGDRFKDDDLHKKHMELLSKEEILTRWNGATGEIEFVKTGQVDTQAVKAGLDMAYKLKKKYPQNNNNTVVPIQINFNEDKERFK